MADLVNIKDFSGASVPVLTDEVTGSPVGAGQVQYMKQMDGTAGSTNVAVVNEAGESLVVQNNQVSIGNTTTVNLAGAAVFTGTGEDISNYSEVRVSVFASHASAVDGLSIQQSPDGTNWDIIDVYTISAGVGKVVTVPVQARFFRVVYTNGATLTTSLRIMSVYHKIGARGSSVRPQDGRTNETDMEESLSYQMVFNGTTWDRQTGTAGALNVRQPDATGTGALAAAAAAVTVQVNGTSSTAIQISGTFVATLQFEGTVDGTNWVSLFSTPNGSATTVTSATAGGVWMGKSGGFSQVRVRASAYTSGTANVTIRAGQGTGNVAVDTPVRLNATRTLSDAQGTTCTTTAATTVIAAGGAGVFHDIIAITIINAAATATVAILSDGTKTYRYPLAAAIGAGATVALTTPRKASTANVAWTLAMTVASTVEVHLDYVKNTA